MKQPKMPKIPEPAPIPPMPPPPEISTSEERARSKWMDRLLEIRRKGRAGTIVTGGMGAPGVPAIYQGGVLGSKERLGA